MLYRVRYLRSFKNALMGASRAEFRVVSVGPFGVYIDHHGWLSFRTKADILGCTDGDEYVLTSEAAAVIVAGVEAARVAGTTPVLA